MFRPEFLNRDRVRQRLADRRITLELTPAAFATW
jgi:hypothetical protein